MELKLQNRHLQPLTELCSAQVWELAQSGKALANKPSNAQPADRYRGPDRGRRYEEAKAERRRRQEEKRAAAAQAAQVGYRSLRS